jgi:site-specific DNA-methyltransferase (cytosine-N4-specific)
MIQKWDNNPYRFILGHPHTSFETAHQMLDCVWTEVKRILVPGGIACINIGDATRSLNKEFCCWPNYARVVMACLHIGFTPLIPILWKKISNRPNAFLGSGMLPPNAYISQDCEYIAIFRKGGLRKFAPKDKTRYASAFTKDERDIWFQQVWKITGAKNAKTTSAFPEEVPYRLIRMFSIIGDIVVDPFAGTGTTGKVAERLDRKFVGYEVKN